MYNIRQRLRQFSHQPAVLYMGRHGDKYTGANDGSAASVESLQYPGITLQGVENALAKTVDLKKMIDLAPP